MNKDLLTCLMLHTANDLKRSLLYVVNNSSLSISQKYRLSQIITDGDDSQTHLVPDLAPEFKSSVSVLIELRAEIQLRSSARTPRVHVADVNFGAYRFIYDKYIELCDLSTSTLELFLAREESVE